MESCCRIEIEGHPDGIAVTGNVPDDLVRANIAHALTLGLPELAERPAHDGEVCIAGGGPSMASSLPLLRSRQDAGAAVWTLNNTHDWLLERGILPEGAWCVDSRPHNARYFLRPKAHCTYYLASRCHAFVFDALRGENVVLWHDNNAAAFTPEGKTLLGGGTTVGMKAIVGAFALGYRKIHLFGFDSSYAGNQHHAYAQPANDGETVFPVEVAGRQFMAALWMIGQVKNFGAISLALAEQGCELQVHGDGLLPWVARQMQLQMEAA